MEIHRANRGQRRIRTGRAAESTYPLALCPQVLPTNGADLPSRRSPRRTILPLSTRHRAGSCLFWRPSWSRLTVLADGPGPAPNYRSSAAGGCRMALPVGGSPLAVGRWPPHPFSPAEMTAVVTAVGARWTPQRALHVSHVRRPAMPTRLALVGSHLRPLAGLRLLRGRGLRFRGWPPHA